ncbi:hypothetical protein INS49_014044 [Diaporthe citri]|uniref:uncharacterized protein n=1 Tax=Diaporthe citri TaxID=83186 RepID=UPI001C806551|nr:uncharacterized protein INS49_014044 [Diaporthe citri]KAG6358160.1 hypothetical protein INS49_014044 [Diaporthe citri]
MTKKIQHCCYTCHKVFNDGDDLRSHVQYFQVRHFALPPWIAALMSTTQYEIQELLARLIEVQAHLPPSNLDNISSDDSDNEDTGTDLDAARGNHRHRCPDPKRLRRESFKEKQGLEIHYQKHVKCLEICACGNIFTNVRAFIRHKCKSSTAKTPKERIKHWRSVSRQKMVVLEKQRAPTGLSVSNRKRMLAETEPLPNPPSKRPRVSDSHTLSQANGCHEAVYLYDPSTLSPSLPGRIGGTPTVSNPLPAPQAFVAGGAAVPSFVPESITAPIFWDNTIPPFPIPQPPDASCFPPNTTFSRNTEAHQLDTSSYYTLPGSAD